MQMCKFQNPEDSVAWEYLKKLEKESDPLVKQELALHVRHAAAVAYVGKILYVSSMWLPPVSSRYS